MVGLLRFWSVRRGCAATLATLGILATLAVCAGSARAATAAARCTGAAAATTQIRGRVLAAGSGAIQGATITPSGARGRARSGRVGTFCLSVRRAPRQLLVARAGYVTAKVKLRRRGSTRALASVRVVLKRKRAPRPPVVPAAPIALGVSVDGAPRDAAKLDEFSALVGGTPAIVNFFQDWGSTVFNVARYDAIASRGSMPMVTWEPWDATAGTPTQPTYTLASIASGAHDAYIQQWAHDAAAWRKPFYMRFAHEMNGDWTSWSPGVNGNTSVQYVQAWRHVHDIFVAQGATNAKWVWAPTREYPGTTPLAGLYPGSSYVDAIGLDAYNGGSGLWGGSWMSLASLIAPTYTKLAALDTSKPIFITETASSPLGGDKATWIRQAYLTDIPTRFPRVGAMMWFQYNKEADWRVESSPSSLAAYRDVVASPLYRGAAL